MNEIDQFMRSKYAVLTLFSLFFAVVVVVAETNVWLKCVAVFAIFCFIALLFRRLYIHFIDCTILSNKMFEHWFRIDGWLYASSVRTDPTNKNKRKTQAEEKIE